MKKLVRLASGLLLLAGLVSCHGIGGGNTVQRLQIVFYPVSGEQGAYLTPENTASQPVPVTIPTLRMFDCFCSTVVVYGYFNDGTVGDITSRATLVSSDPTTVEVAKFDTTQPCSFAQNDPALFSLIPKKTGTVTLTAQFVGLSATLDVRVDDTATALQDPNNGNQSTLHFVSSDTTQASPQVAVGGTIRLLLQGMLENDGVTRTFNNNVHTDGQTVNGVTTTHTNWTMMSPVAGHTTDDCTVPRFDLTPIPESCPATLSKAALNGGVIFGIAPTGTTPLTVQASFGSCGITASKTVQVGDISQLTVAEEDNFYPNASPSVPAGASDGLLASNSNEIMKVTATLDFHDGGAAGTQLLSPVSSIATTDNCTFIDHDPAPSNASGTLCRTQTTTCAGTVAYCATAPTICASTFAGCRSDKPPIQPSLFTQILANAASSTNGPTAVTARFPGSLPAQTHLSAQVTASASDTSILLDALTPTTAVPWYAIISKGASDEETVRVTAISGTTVTVVRANPPLFHAQGATFDQRSYTSSNALNISAKAGTLTQFSLMDATNTNSVSGTILTGTSTPALTSTGQPVQLQALGTYDDGTSTRQQNVSHLTALNSGPAMVWTTSNSRVATISAAGLVTPNGICGGSAAIRARATTSTNTTDHIFAPTITTTDTDGNFNDDANDAACLSGDPLCDQVNLCIVTPTTLPLGSLCPAVTTYDSANQKCVVTCTAPATYNSATGTCVTP